MPDFRRTLERAFRRRIVVKDTADAVVASGASAQLDEVLGGDVTTAAATGTIAHHARRRRGVSEPLRDAAAAADVRARFRGVESGGGNDGERGHDRRGALRAVLRIDRGARRAASGSSSCRRCFWRFRR